MTFELEKPSTVDPKTFEEYEAVVGDDDLEAQFEFCLDYWRDRNVYIDQIRMHVEGLNPIAVPKSKYYKAKILRAYSMTSIINEKQARYLVRPEAQVIVEDPTNSEEVTRSSEIERALRAISYEAERLGDGDVWDRILVDVHLLDEGVEKILFNPVLHWPELVAAERAQLTDAIKSPYEMGSKRREDYLKERGCAIESHYVPLENFLPIYDGNYLRMSYEVDVKTLYSCRKSPLFDTEMFDDFAQDKHNGLETMVPIVHHCNDLFIAYYALPPGTPGWDVNNRMKIDVNNMTPGDLQLLYVFKHGLGFSAYNCVGGRFGGWKTQYNRIEAVNKGILQMSQATDELWSQIFTNIRAVDWPSMNFQVNPDLRGYTQGGTTPPAPEVTEGEEIVTFIGEKIEPIVKPMDDAKVPWLMGEIRNQLGNLGGSSVLFGHRQPGVDTGYQNQQQISQAEHLDSKVEEHLQQGAIRHFTTIMQYAKVFGEPLYGYFMEPPNKTGKRTGRYVKLDPDELSPMPKIDTKVRKTRPMDFIAALRAGKEASDDRQGKGPQLSDYTIRTEILGRDAADLEKDLIRIETLENQALKSPEILKLISDATNLKVAEESQQQLNPQAISQGNPAAIQAAIELIQNSAQSGGLDTNLLLQLLQQAANMPPSMNPQFNPQMNGNGAGGTGIRSGGMLPGDAGQEARVGEAIAGAQNVGAGP